MVRWAVGPVPLVAVQTGRGRVSAELRVALVQYKQRQSNGLYGTLVRSWIVRFNMDDGD